MEQLYKVCLIDTDELVCEGFETFADAERFIERQPCPNSLYVGFYNE